MKSDVDVGHTDTMTGRPAVLLDRDGTLIEEVGYLDRIERLKLFPWSIDSVRLLNRAGFKVAVVSNQAGVARGFFDETFVGEVEEYLARRMSQGGARIDGFYYCPHHPDATIERYRKNCECRKPRPGLALAAAAELGLDLGRSFVVGDRWLDVQLGHAAGARSILVRTGYGRTEEERGPGAVAQPYAVVENLIEAVSVILGTGVSAGAPRGLGRPPSG
ncbi:MAG: D-glycero-alpha-D-manno-heptose-1,7-bisphosphate 7-phosphatase [Vicinamibacterales bacterium]